MSEKISLDSSDSSLYRAIRFHHMRKLEINAGYNTKKTFKKSNKINMNANF